MATPSPTFSAAPTAHSSSPSSSPCKKGLACYEYNEYVESDASRDLTNPCHGWPKLVEVMVDQPGLESFQAFRDLNIKSLLYYQAELVKLRKDLHALEWEDHRKGGEASLFCENVDKLLATKDESIECQEAQFRKVKEMRVVLKDYNAALLQYTEINKLPKAETFNVTTLRKWIDSHIMETLTILGPGSDSWGILAQKGQDDIGLGRHFWKLLKSIFREERLQEDLDLVIPGKEEHTDSLTRWVATQGTPFWHKLKSTFRETKIYKRVAQRWLSLCRPSTHVDEERRSQGEIPGDTSTVKNSRKDSFITIFRTRIFQQESPAESKDGCASLSTYSISRMIRFTNFVATLIACLLPIVGIIVLSEVHTKAKTLGFIALFTAIFAIGIMVLTDSRTSRTEVFTATAAFAAVLVVFVQNQSPASVGS
ncbi:hypothetical protein LSUE1_G003723 [Lachnellula suecica]|uniref:DUF6594 domain-containing protein n=1 Tax=Lachnellula suecica TaxID=602035 RepID=A0A8T9CEY7_9HELO|nr:hypothetical protein LSUE1_G003723 [Lachnellula suecica]